MLKVIGCTLILAGMTGYGVSSVCYMKRHLEELVEYKEILYALLGEIQHYRKPLAEAFDSIAKKRAEGYRQVLEMIAARMKKFEEAKGSEIWEDSFLSCSRKFLFSREEEEIIQKSGHFLDAPDMESQKRELELYEAQIDYRIAEIQKTIGGKRKVCMYGSVLGGLFLIILLI